MFRKDLITAEIQKLAEVLARIMGLKLEGKIEESDQLFEDSLLDEFDLIYGELLDFSQSDFKNYFAKNSFSAQKLELLSQFLYYKIAAFDNVGENKDVAERLLQLYNFIEQEHHVSSIENINRQNQVKAFLYS